MAALRSLRFWMVSRQVSSDPASGGRLRCILTTRVRSLVLQVRSKRQHSLETLN